MRVFMPDFHSVNYFLDNTGDLDVANLVRDS